MNDNVMTKDDEYPQEALDQSKKDSPGIIKFILPLDQEGRGLESGSTREYGSFGAEAHNTSLEIVGRDVIRFVRCKVGLYHHSDDIYYSILKGHSSSQATMT